MSIKSTSSPAPPRASTTHSFQSLGLIPPLVQATDALGFTAATPIQVQAIPPALEGRDVLGCAMTGSGKTAAFLLPTLSRLQEGPRKKTRALILAPTRELAAQVEEECRHLARFTGLRVKAIFGGVGMGPQEEAFRNGTEILVATPGRLLDHFQHPYAALPAVEVLVLDEADRMLDMGFLPDIRRVLRHLPAGPRQTFFFSATMPPPILKLASELLKNPVRVDVERKQAPATGITQAVFPVPSRRKPELLIELLTRGEIGNVIVFCRTKHRVNRLHEKLEKAGIASTRMHGNRSQAQRTQALEGFRQGKYQVLAATDIVARGIDVEALDHVVNFDVPAQPEDYIHRVGRTARAGATGEAYTFVSPEEEAELRSIERAVGHSIARRILEGFDYSAPEVERFEVPVAERIAAMRAERQKARERQREKEARRQGGAPATSQGGAGSSAGGGGGRKTGGPATQGAGAGAGSRASAGASGQGTARAPGGGGGEGGRSGSPRRRRPRRPGSGGGSSQTGS
jgi:ATP-dependent RNA helicase RhlE